jgi:AraC-like DNA-binding protein
LHYRGPDDFEQKRPSPPVEILSGNLLQLPLVAEIGATPRHLARLVPWHAHAGGQILCVLRGATAYQFQSRRCPRIEVPGGHFLVIPAGLAHRGAAEVRPPCMIVQVVLGPAPARPGGTPLAEADWRWLRRRLEAHLPSVHPFNGELQRLVTGLIRAVPAAVAQPRDRLLLARLRLQTCALLLEAAAQVDDNTRAAPDDLVQAAAAYFRARLDEKIRLGEVARSLGVNRTRLFEQFKRATGLTPNDYLLRARVDRARELLADARKSVTEVAFAVGLGSSQYFSTVFRRYTGQTPGDFRRSLGRGSK